MKVPYRHFLHYNKSLNFEYKKGSANSWPSDDEYDLQDDDVDGSGDFFEGSGEDDEDLGSAFYPLEW